MNIGNVEADKVDRAHFADLVLTLRLLIRAHETLLTDAYIHKTNSIFMCKCFFELSIADRIWPRNVEYCCTNAWMASDEL